MRKAIKIILFFIICIILSFTVVKAEEEACKITLESSKETLNPGEEVTITLTMSDISKTQGIINFISVLDFSDEVFEVEFDEDEELSSALKGTELEACQILYSGDKDSDATIKNPWYILYIESEGDKGIYGSTSADPQIENQIIGKIKLKVRPDVKSTKTKISIIGTEVYDADAIINSESTGELVGYSISDAEIELQINANTEGNAGNGNSVPQNNINNTTNVNKTNTNTNTNVNTNKPSNVNKQVENKATQDVPYAGLEDWVPVIFIGIIISVMTYINYRKYKDI